MHQQLDQDNVEAAKVLFNLMLRLKQHFKENKEFQNAFQSDKLACYHSDHYFRSKNLQLQVSQSASPTMRWGDW